MFGATWPSQLFWISASSSRNGRSRAGKFRFGEAGPSSGKSSHVAMTTPSGGRSFIVARGQATSCPTSADSFRSSVASGTLAAHVSVSPSVPTGTGPLLATFHPRAGSNDGGRHVFRGGRDGSPEESSRDMVPRIRLTSSSLASGAGLLPKLTHNWRDRPRITTDR